MEEGQSLISPEVLARYAGDAARDVPGVAGLAESSLQRGRAIDVSNSNGSTEVTVHIDLEWGSRAEEVAREVQQRVAEYLERMAGLTVRYVDVIFEGMGAPPAKQ